MACGGSKGAKMLTVADVTGTYEGVTMAEGSDSVVSTWTVWLSADDAGGAAGKIVNHAAPMDTVTFTETISGDSMIGASSTYVPAGSPAGSPEVHWTSVGRVASGNEWTGTVVVMMAGTDSVIQRSKWKGTRTP